MTTNSSRDITVAIATIPPRTTLLAEAISSVQQQRLQPAAVVIESDRDRTGAASTKNRALARVETEWVAWLDDDDLLKPEHLATLRTAADESGADVVYAWPEFLGHHDPRPDRFGAPFDADELRCGNYIHTTCLFRAELARSVGGFQYGPGTHYDDWGLWLALLDVGARFHHAPAQTWIYRFQGQNTSGLPDRW